MDRKRHRIFWGCAAAVLLTAIVAFFTCFQITSVKVEGNQNYTEDEIRKMVLTGPLSGNSVLVRFLNPDERTKDAEFIKKAWIERTGSHQVVIHVREKELIGYVRFLDGYLYFDRDGIIQVSSVEALDNIPYIEGLELDNVRIGDKVPGLDKNSLNLILSVTKMLEKEELQPDRIVMNTGSGLVMYYDKVEVRLGSDENTGEKISRMIGILPQLEGMEGVLHLENTDASTRNIVFDKTLSEEEKKAQEEAKKSKSEDSTEGQEDQEGSDGSDYQEEGYDDGYSDEEYNEDEDGGYTEDWDEDYEEGEYGW